MALVAASPGFWLVLYSAPDKGKGRSFFNRQPIIAWDIDVQPARRVPITPTDETTAWPPADTFIELPDGRLVQGVIEFAGMDGVIREREGPRPRRAR